MEWSDDGIVLSARRHGESGAIVSLLTAGHGRHAGLVRGGAGRAKRGMLQPGNAVRATWRARLAEHLGAFTVEPVRAWSAELMDDPVRLAALSAICAVADAALPEREPHGPLYEGLGILLAALADDDGAWPAVYVRWELGLLAELGYGLELDACAATGVIEDLTHVSPKSGRAVSAAAAAPYAGRLLALPAFLAGARGGPPANDPRADWQAGLDLTGHFLEARLFATAERRLPEARNRFIERFRLSNTTSGAA